MIKQIWGGFVLGAFFPWAFILRALIPWGIDFRGIDPLGIDRLGVSFSGNSSQEVSSLDHIALG